MVYPDDALKSLLKQAKALFDLKRHAEARALLEKGLAINPEDSRLNSFLAYLYYRLGDLDKARDAYIKLVWLESDNISAWSNLGLIYFKLGQMEDAYQAFAEYLKRKPDDPKVLSYMGLLQEKMGRPAQAKKFYTMAEAEREADRTPSTPVTEDELPFRTAPAESAPPVITDQPVREAPAAAAGESTEEPRDTVPPEEEELADDSLTPGEWRRRLDSGKVAGPGQFLLSSPSTVSIGLERGLCFSLPSLSVYRGVVVFHRGPQPYSKVPRKYRHESLSLGLAEGNGELWLTHEAGGLVTMVLENEAFQVNGYRLVAFENTLRHEWRPVGKDGFLPGLAILRLAGWGKLVLAAGPGVAPLASEAGDLTFVRPPMAVAWSDGLHTSLEASEDLQKVKGASEAVYLRFDGRGVIFVSGSTVGDGF